MLATLLQTFALGEASGAAKRVRRAAIDYAIAGILLAIGLGFLIAAGYIYAADKFGPLNAALGIGGAFVFLSIVMVVTHRVVAEQQARRRAKEARAAQISSLVGAAAVAALPTLLRGGGVVGLAAPIVAMAAYAIYKENGGGAKGDDGPTA